MDSEPETARLQKRIESLEEKIALLSDKLSSTQTSIENIATFRKAKPTLVQAPVTQNAGVPPTLSMPTRYGDITRIFQ